MPDKRKPVWRMHSSQVEAIKDILGAGGTVQLTYEVRPKGDEEALNRRLQVEAEGKQRL